MVQDSHTQLVDLIARLKRAEIDWDAENIADLVWLSRFIEMSDVEQSETVPSKSVSPKIRTEDIASQPSESDIPLYIPPSPQQQSSVPEVSKSGIPFQTPIAPALRKTLAIGRALRPLMRKVESYTQTVLDEDATAERTAEQQFCMTIIRPAQERWLELTLVVEESASSFLWQETIRDFKQLLERQGAFRSVSVWYLRTDAEGELNLFAKRPTGPLKPLPRSPRELIDASGRRLILLVSDCISPAWRTGNLHKYCLDLWAKKGLLAIVQLLPGHMWHRTALNTGLNVHLGALKPGVPNQQLLIQETPIGLGNKAESGLKLPIVTLAPSSLGQWTRMVAGFGESWTTGIWFDEGWQDWPQVAVTPAESLMPEQLVKRFMTTASGLAKRLAGLMALVPVSLPIIYLIQETMLTESTPLQVAEVFMSGLVQRIEDESAEEEFQNSTEQNYEFVPGVRNVLIESVDTPTAEAVLDRVSQYIGEKVGRSIYSFTALLMLEEEFIGIAGAEFLQFASIAKQVLQHLGGDYAVLLNDMTQVTISNSSEILFSQSLADFPPLKILEFTTAYFGGLPKPETSIPSKTKNKSFSENIGFHTKLKELSPRRREVLDCWLAGQSDRQIAAGLVITEGTVRKHFESLYKLFLGPRSYPDNRSRRDELEALFRQHRSDMVAPFDFHTRLKELSPRLREVLESWLAGQNDRQIAAELVITEGTVRKHFESLYKLFLGPSSSPDNRSRRDELEALFRQHRPDMVAPFDFHTRLKELSPRRREVLEYWLAGQSDKQIAAELVITEGTVRKHFESLYKLFLGPSSSPDNRSRRDELGALFRQHRPDMVQRVTSRAFWSGGRADIGNDNIQVNPYDPWTPAGKNRFVGRQVLLRRLQIALEDRNSVSIVGDWCIGKTSVLKEWVKQLKKRGRIVKFVSGEEAAGASQAAFVSAITERPLTTSDADVAANVLLRWAQEVALPNIPPVIVVDETDGLLGRSEYRFFERLRAMLGQIIFVMASRQKLVEVFDEVMGKTSPFTNRLQEHQLGLLEPAAANKIIGWGTYIFQTEGAKILQTWAGQHPFYLQLLGRYLVEACHNGQTFDDALDRFLNEASSRLHSQWNVLNEREQEDLYEYINTGQPVVRRSLRMRGMVTAQGEPFGRILVEWLREQS